MKRNDYFMQVSCAANIAVTYHLGRISDSRPLANTTQDTEVTKETNTNKEEKQRRENVHTLHGVPDG